MKMFLFMSNQNKYSYLDEQHHKELHYMFMIFFPYQVRAQIHFEMGRTE